MTVIAPSAGNSSINPEPKDIFSSEENILRALAFVRHSPIPVKQKDALRDLFLSYAGTYEDARRQQVKNQIIEILSSHKELSSLLPKVKTKGTAKGPAQLAAIGSTRPVPTFAFSQPAQPAADLPPAVPLPKKEVAPAPITESIPVAKPEPRPPAAPTAVVPPREPASPVNIDQNAKARINVIKRDINGKIGNPVNLIDADEKVGREYMSALLDAMRRSSKGDNDLSRLESAYQAALVVIQKGLPPAATTPPTEVETPEPIISTPNPAPAPTAPTPAVKVIPNPPPQPTPPPPAPIVTPTSIMPEPEVRPSMKSEPKSGLYHQPTDDVEETITPISAPEVSNPGAMASLSSNLLKKEVVAELRETQAPNPAPKEVVPKPPPTPTEPEVKKAEPVSKPAPAPPDEKLRPVKDTDQTLPEQISKLKAAASVREEAAKKPIIDLNAPEIDQGLRQLLGEWTLFKGGGLFRTKPSGIESALYKQLSKMPMASVIAGRFEGVTPEIKRELADYMTGWRYERGIVHEMGETFEHYLRRVVKEILERQRKAKTTNTPASAK